MEVTMSKIKQPAFAVLAVALFVASLPGAAIAQILSPAAVPARSPVSAQSSALTTPAPVPAPVAVGSPASRSTDITINDLANAQRAKLADEILKARGLPTQSERQTLDSQAAAAAATVRAAAPRPSQLTRSGIAVHGIYSRGSQGRIVELTDGRSLYEAKPGSKYGAWKVTEVNDLGVMIQRINCKKKCGPDRQVVVGGAF